MAILDAENSFKKGLVALVDHRPAEATAHFEAAIRIERTRGVNRPQLRYLSFLGLASAMAGRPTREAVRLCEIAASREFYNPDLHLNLARVYRMAGKTTRALEVLERGLRIAPRHRGLRNELAKVDRRAHPPVGWLSRNHPINRFLGRVRATFCSSAPRNISARKPVVPS